MISFSKQEQKSKMATIETVIDLIDRKRFTLISVVLTSFYKSRPWVRLQLIASGNWEEIFVIVPFIRMHKYHRFLHTEWLHVYVLGQIRWGFGGQMYIGWVWLSRGHRSRILESLWLRVHSKVNPLLFGDLHAAEDEISSEAGGYSSYNKCRQKIKKWKYCVH